MEESPAQSEQPNGEQDRFDQRLSLQQLIERVDASMPSPEVRAMKVWNALNKEGLNLWDLSCFCVETLGYLSSVIPDFEPAAKQMSLQLYARHYQAAGAVLAWSQEPSNQLDKIIPEEHSNPVKT